MLRIRGEGFRDLNCPHEASIMGLLLVLPAFIKLTRRQGLSSYQGSAYAIDCASGHY